MKYKIIVVAIICLLVFSFAASAAKPTDKKDDGKIKLNASEKHNAKTVKSEYNERVTVTTIVASFFDKVKGLLGWEKKEKSTTEIDVLIDGKRVATLPSDSKLVGMKVHDVCLVYQYGTINWYNCEVQLQ